MEQITFWIGAVRYLDKNEAQLDIHGSDGSRTLVKFRADFLLQLWNCRDEILKKVNELRGTQLESY